MAEFNPAELFDTPTKAAEEQSPDYSDMGELERSLNQIGQLYGNIVCLQHPDRVLSGRHRKSLGFDKATTIDIDSYAHKWKVSHYMAELIVMSHSNVQRRVPRAERKAELMEMAKELEAKGTPKDRVSTELPRWFPGSPRWVRELLPDEYKQEQFNRFEKTAEVIPPSSGNIKPSCDSISPTDRGTPKDERPTTKNGLEFLCDEFEKFIRTTETCVIEGRLTKSQQLSLLRFVHDQLAKGLGLDCYEGGR